ncbi:MAG: diadenylate cyclase CdaA [Defluviitaleaceae bacterium]|nr:diadenylate cyclase CdaA [Defluviitaleaceae bacterium]
MINGIRAALSNLDISFRSVSAVGVSDVIDILIVAGVIYFILMWIKETRAWSLLKGFIVLLVVGLLAYFLNLTTVNWIIANTFSIGLIALVVIFQPELRKALERIGRGSFFEALTGDGNEQLSESTLDEIISAATDMAKTKTGALIVIEQKIPLGDFEATGVAVDAQVSAQLIMNIFSYGAPLHDGAIVIRGNRISAASCILPLASDVTDKKMGTRHRAAIGATELSDAYAIVVSEETGTVSVAYGGKLRRRLSEKQIKEIIMPHAAEEDGGQKYNLAKILNVDNLKKKFQDDKSDKAEPK